METDPAKELADLFDGISRYQTSSQDAAYSVLASYFGLQHTNTLLYELFGCVAQRTNSTKDFISELQDDHLDEGMRSALVSGLNRSVQVISPALMSTRWDHVKSNIKGNDVLLLKSFSQTARRYKPLRVATPEELVDLGKKIELALSELDEASDVPEWAKSSIKEGLRRLSIILQYVNVFGHDAIIDHVLKIHADVTAISSFLDGKGFKYGKTLFKTAGVIATAVNIFVAPIKAREGYIGYKEHHREIINIVPQLIAPVTKLLPKPSTDNTDVDLSGP